VHNSVANCPTGVAEDAIIVDHVPVAVSDLERAADTYRRLGFVLKPGMPHANGIRNLHAKFIDGTEIELITAPAGVDDLTRKYRAHLEQGDGPAFLALHAPDPPLHPPARAGSPREQQDAHGRRGPLRSSGRR
jgi:hypothetical protein